MILLLRFPVLSESISNDSLQYSKPKLTQESLKTFNQFNVKSRINLVRKFAQHRAVIYVRPGLPRLRFRSWR